MIIMNNLKNYKIKYDKENTLTNRYNMHDCLF